MEATILGYAPVVVIAGVLAFYMAWAIGANDVANAMGTSVGSGSLSIRNAVIVAGVLEFCGAFFVGGHVTDTVRKGILTPEAVASDPQLLLYGMLGSLAAAATLLVGATKFGLPVSTTHSIVGAIVGFGAVGLGSDAVVWSKVLEIVGSWLTSPLLGGVLGFGIFHLIRVLILNREDPLAASRRWGPAFFFLVFFIIGLVTLFKGLKNLNLDFDFPEALMLSALLGLLGAGLGRLLIARVKPAGGDPDDRFYHVERVFVVLVVLTACAVAFAHGSNDVANAIGPLAAIINIEQGVEVAKQAAVAPWMLVVGGIGIVIGLATWRLRSTSTIFCVSSLSMLPSLFAATASNEAIAICAFMSVDILSKSRSTPVIAYTRSLSFPAKCRPLLTSLRYCPELTLFCPYRSTG